MSNAQRPRYMKTTTGIGKRKKERKKYPANLRDINGKIHSEKGFVLYPPGHTNAGKRVLLNPDQAGKPRYKILNGNDFTFGFKNEHEKNAVVRQLKEYLLANMAHKLPPFTSSEFPLVIDFYMYEYLPDRGDDWDVGNEWYWSKYMEDMLTEMGKYPDDAIMYVIKSGGPPELVPVDSRDKRKLVWHFYKKTDLNVVRYWPWTKTNLELPNLTK